MIGQNCIIIFSHFRVSLQKISCTRQFESKLSLRSFALSLQQIKRQNVKVEVMKK